jgi:hypothetical protein
MEHGRSIDIDDLRYLTQGMAKSISEISLPRPKLIFSSGTWCIIRVKEANLSRSLQSQGVDALCQLHYL